MSKVTPMLRQYREIKARFPDALVMFRLGDFYELFGEDAQIAARELELVLTSRSFSKETRLPMCGVPHHTVTSYIARLIERGYKIALVEQLEDARRVKRLVQRDVVRVITPGTVVEEALLREKADNYLAAVTHEARRQEAYGLAALDLSTGEFVTTQLNGDDAWGILLEELTRLGPAEIVLPATLATDERFSTPMQALGPARLSPLSDERCTPEAGRQALLEHFGVASLEAYGCDDLPLAQAAAGAIIAYLRTSQLGDVPVTGLLSGGTGLAHITTLRTYRPGEHMTLDAVTRRNLELLTSLRDGSPRGTLFSVLDQTQTAMGARLLRRWITQPLLDVKRIRERLDAVEALVSDGLLRHDLRVLLDGLYDVERLAGRIGFGSANARDLVALRRAIERLPAIRRHLERVEAPRLRALYDQLDELQDIARLIGEAIVDRPPILVREGGLIRRGFNADLDSLHRRAEEGESWLAELEARERERTGIKTLRVRYNEVFGFFIEVPRSRANSVPADYERKATITHAERFVTPALKAREADILITRDRIKELEYDLFIQVREAVAAHTARLIRSARVLAELDVLAALAEVAARNGYVKPVVDEARVIEIREGRHPVVEHLLPDGERFVPNDLHLDDEQRMIVLTGPNMSGKSVYIRQNALIVLMAQIGSFVPAASARIGLVDRIFVRAGATDDIAQGRSTFLVEMAETAAILRHATPRSLIILDEVGRGTSTYDGMSIAWAVAEEIHNALGAHCLFATHYHELTALADHLPAARNYSMAVAERGDRVVFLRRVVPGGVARSFGIHVARLAGLPVHVVERAAEVLANLEGKKSTKGERVKEETQGREDTKGIGVTEAIGQERAIREAAAPYLVASEASLSLPYPFIALLSHGLGASVPLETIAAVLSDLCQADIANLTPVQALVLLNELQRRLRGHNEVSRP
ncbi:MAG: DNA mismatch repair protein MutS [Anaerolineae bacterium]|nr:DNA mismatch repair protein MutS [Anaerolineae bacterium]